MKRLGASTACVFCVLALGACASFPGATGSVFENSALHNFNPAPASMSPPQQVAGKNATLDPLYMRNQADYHYSLGEAYSLEGNAEKAIEEFKLTLVYDSKSPEVHTRLAQEYVNDGLLSEAVDEAQTAISLDPKSIDPKMVLGELYTSLKMYDLAVDQFQQVMKLDPFNQNATIYIGVLLAEQQKYNQAVKTFQRWTKWKKIDDPSLPYFYIGLVRRRQALKSSPKKAKWALAKATDGFEKAISIKPDSEDAVLMLGQVYTKQGKPDKATRLYESFQDKFGPREKIAGMLAQTYLQKNQNKKALEQLYYLENFDGVDGEVKEKIGLILTQMKLYDEAIEKLNESLSLNPASDKARFYLAAVYEETKRNKEAIEQYLKVPSSSLYFEPATIHAAYLQKQANSLDAALATVKSALTKQNQDPQLYVFYASLLNEKKDYKTGIAMLKKAVTQFPRDPQLFFFLGAMYDKMGKVQKTIEDMKKVVALDANHVQALNYLAYTYAELNEHLDQAADLAQQALKLQPNDPYILDTVGWVKFKQGKLKKAIQFLETAYKLKSTEGIIAEHLGDAYYRYQLVDKAKKMYLKAVAVEKNEKKLDELKAKIVAIEQQQAQDRQPASIHCTDSSGGGVCNLSTAKPSH